MRLRVLVFVIVMAGAAPLAAVDLSAEAVATADQPQPPKDFVPVDQAAAGEQIPAMPLLGAAYGFIWVGVLAYVWSLARRLQRVETEISELERRRK